MNGVIGARNRRNFAGAVFGEMTMDEASWTRTMRNIDAEFDLPQFEASALVRRIAANDFRLPTADRERFAKIPDRVIARIEEIVRDASQRMTYEALMRDARREANTHSTRVRAAFGAVLECCKRKTGLPGTAEVVIDTALLALDLSDGDNAHLRELCGWALHAAPFDPPLSATNAIELAVRVHSACQ